MDTRPTETADEQIALIKARMPETYKAIQAKSTQWGNQAFALVRRGCRGEVNAFYAFERGHVVGTPFRDMEVERDIAQALVQFGVAHVCIWGKPATALQGGA